MTLADSSRGIDLTRYRNFYIIVYDSVEKANIFVGLYSSSNHVPNSNAIYLYIFAILDYIVALSVPP